MARGAKVHAYHEDELLGKAYDWGMIKRLGRYLVPYKKHVLVAGLLSVVLAITETAGPVIISRIIDGPIRDQNTGGVAKWSMIFLGVVLVGMAVEYAAMYMIQWIGQMGMRDIRHEIFGKFQRLHLQHFDKNPVGRLLTRITSDVNVLNELFASGVVSFFRDSMAIVVFTAAMLWHSPALTLVIYCAVPVIFFISWVFRQRVRVAFGDMRARLSRLNAYIQESVTGVRTIQVFNREERAQAEFEDHNGALCDAHRRTITNYAWFFPSIEFTTTLAIAGLIVVGANLASGAQLSVGVLVMFILFAQRFFRPIQDLSERYNVLQSAIVSSERIFKLIDAEEKIANPPEPKPLRFDHEIEFRNVWFAYNGEDWVLKDVSFTVPKGQTVALVGATGAGKSTVTNLLLRLYDIQRGQILVDGVDLREFDKHDVRRMFGVVPQDLFLFQGDIAENIRLGRSDITDEQITKILEYVNAWRFVEKRQGQLHAPVHERGGGFSVGEKQLLAFARALAFNPNVLILDEATSSVDTETEQLIQETLEKVMASRTSIVVAHRLSTIQRASEILVFHHGKIHERGTHQDLLAQGGIYRDLYELQFKHVE